MLVFSNPTSIKVIIAIGVAILWIGTGWITYIYGHRRGYAECMNKVRAKRRVQRKPIQNGDIRVLNPVEPRKRYTEAENVRIVSTHAPRFEEEDTWM